MRGRTGLTRQPTLPWFSCTLLHVPWNAGSEHTCHASRGAMRTLRTVNGTLTKVCVPLTVTLDPIVAHDTAELFVASEDRSVARRRPPGPGPWDADPVPPGN